uniref:NADH-ubiquinone oxidoreductase chain 2 n=1 Tax=Boreus elegans TaxID=948611 RepID=E9NQ59_BOREL|nr:NADH dehydrogenase subunit 2 [Boreus elegans]
MLNNPTKLLFLSMLMIGTLISISSNNWISVWMGLEMNLLSFIPLMINKNNSLSTEASLKYFLIQTLSSTSLLFSIILMSILNYSISSFFMMNNIILLIINSSLLLKMGAAPFYFWFPEMMEGLSWNNCLILMTWQKISPLILISFCLMNNLILMIIFLSVMIGSIMGLNQISLRKLMAYSSINHLGWMLASLISSENIFISYFIMYSLLSFTILWMFNLFQIFQLNQIFMLTQYNYSLKFSMFISLLSLGGLPPFLGFLPKWIVIQSMIDMNLIFMITIMMIMSLVTLYFYIRITYSSFLLSYNELKWMNISNYKNNNFIFMMIFNIISIMSLFMISLLFYMY